jgi:hypothetical protein
MKTAPFDTTGQRIYTRIVQSRDDREDIIRNSTAFFAFTATSIVILLLLAVHAVSGQRSFAAGDSALAGRLKLTDLCLFTEARYTRHPAMADNHAAFQEHPAALDHFPSGSILMPQTMGRSGR